MKLTDEMHDAVANSEVGQFLDRMIRHGINERDEGVDPASFDGSVIQALWAAFMSGAEGKSFREIKNSIATMNGGTVSGE